MFSFSELRKHSYLMRQYLGRQIALRYKSTALGVVWSLLNPLFMLVIYTFVFGVDDACPFWPGEKRNAF